MAARLRIFSAVFIFCAILPLLASAFLGEVHQLIPNILPEDDSGSSIEKIRGHRDHFTGFGALFAGSREEKERESSKDGFTSDKRSKHKEKKSSKRKEKKTPIFITSDVNEPGGNQEKGEEEPFGKEDAEQSQFVPAAPGPVEQLRVNYYERSCPRAEQIVKEVFAKANQNDSGLAAAIVRLHVHDCFVQGCDASILLDKNPTGEPVEKAAGPNGEFIRGTEVIDEIKAKLENECPGIVSCADILTYATRDALILSGLPSYDVPGGRRDGLSSLESNVLANVPIPDNSMEKIIDLFASKGLNVEELVVLTGAHSIGVAHCGNFAYRVNDAVKVKEMDPRLTGLVRFACGNPKSTLPFDSSTQYKLDSTYYKQLLMKRGLLESDQFMGNDPKTRDFVKKFANDQNGWFEKFAAAMVKMSKIEVLTGGAGQIRKQCRLVN